jgi:gas vesicle protein
METNPQSGKQGYSSIGERGLRANNKTRALGGLIVGAIIGSTLMYLLDPRQGNRRRALTRDRANRIMNRGASEAGKTLRHLRNKLEGAFSNITKALRPEGAVSDRKLEERIRTTVGRTLLNPKLVDFVVHEGRVSVRGNLKPHEAGQVIQAIERVPGVAGVDNQIVEVHGVHGVQ